MHIMICSSSHALLKSSAVLIKVTSHKGMVGNKMADGHGKAVNNARHASIAFATLN